MKLVSPSRSFTEILFETLYVRSSQLSDKKPRLKSTKLFEVGENRGATPQMDVQHWRIARIFLDPVVTFDSLEIAEKAGSFLSLSYAVISPWHI